MEKEGMVDTRAVAAQHNIRAGATQQEARLGRWKRKVGSHGPGIIIRSAKE